MNRISSRLDSLGIVLPASPSPTANYESVAIAGDLLFLSGQGPESSEGHWHVGKVGAEIPVEEAYQHARLVGIRLLAAALAALGSLDRVKRVVKLLGFVNAVPEFGEHPQVINGCSDLLVEVFGEAGRHARSAIGVGSLPRNMSVEIEAIFEIQPTA